MSTTSTLSVVNLMRERLATLEPIELEVIDDSALHAGHAGARNGGGHYRLTIVSPRFINCSTMQKHRLVYDALGSLMKREIHALSINALTPESS
ncbi:MAG: BolA family protein [Rugosibacter sp.]|jgi:BolA protein|nr:BolA family protein [Rugosibacter sp.]MDO9272556.1 BolA family protein [Rugosibacter sp.]